MGKKFEKSEKSMEEILKLLNTTMKDVKEDAAVYFARLVADCIMERSVRKGEMADVYDLIEEMPASTPISEIASMQKLVRYLEKIDLDGLGCVATVLTGCNLKLIRLFIEEFLDEIYNIIADDIELFEEDAVLELKELSDIKELLDAMDEEDSCKDECRLGLKDPDIRICRKCNHYQSGENGSVCDGCMGASMGDCSVCRHKKGCGRNE